MSLYSGPDTASGHLFKEVERVADEFKTRKARLDAADGDQTKAVQAYVDAPSDNEGVKLRKQIDEAMSKLKALAEKNVQTVTLSDDQKAKLNKEVDELRTKFRKSRAAVEAIAETIGTDEKGVKSALKELGDPTKSGRGRKPGSKGSGLPRVSATVHVKGGNLDEEYSSFSAAAMALNMGDEGVKNLQVAFADAAKVAHSDISKVKESITFKIKPNENGAEYTVTTKPKDRKKPGPKAKAEGESTPKAEPAKATAAA